jgi:aminobenzoyl-glutamate transport protein
VVAGLVIDKVLEPRMTRLDVPRDHAAVEDEDVAEDDDTVTTSLTREERKGLLAAVVALAVVAVVMVVALLVPGSPWRNPEGGFLPESPLLDSVVFIVFVLFLVPAIVYGFVAGTLRHAADVPKVMGMGIKDMSSFSVLAFMLGQFIALFNWTNVGSALAVGGAQGLKSIGLTGFPAIVCFIILCSLLNLFIVSGSSMWTLVGAVFVPMFALLGYEPGFVQGAFRIGDSATQVVTPMNPYVFVLLMMVRRYEPEAGLGTVISRMLPFVVPFWVAWVVVLAVFYGLDLDMGPGVGIRLD